MDPEPSKTATTSSTEVCLLVTVDGDRCRKFFTKLFAVVWVDGTFLNAIKMQYLKIIQRNDDYSNNKIVGVVGMWNVCLNWLQRNSSTNTWKLMKNICSPTLTTFWAPSSLTWVGFKLKNCGFLLHILTATLPFTVSRNAGFYIKAKLCSAAGFTLVLVISSKPLWGEGSKWSMTYYLDSRDHLGLLVI